MASAEILAEERSAATRWRVNLCCAGLVLAIAVVYAFSLGAPFTFDDFGSIVLNGRVRSVLGHAGSRGFTDATFAWNYYVGGYDPWGYRLVNVIVHAGATLTLFAIARRTMRLGSMPQFVADNADWFAAEIALLWAVHPLQTQSVTYVVQRYESLMGCFYLLSLYGLLRGALATQAAKWYALAVGAMALGAHCKESMVTAPLVLLLFDRTYLASSWRQLFRRRWVVYLSLLIVSRHLFYGGWRLLTATPSPSDDVGFGIDSVTSWEYLRTQPQIVLHYLSLAAWPSTLCLDYQWPVARGWADIVPAGTIIVALLALCVLAYFRWPKVAFLGIAFFLTLAPTSSFIPIRDLAFEHRMYLPLAPLSALAVLGWHGLFARFASSLRGELRLLPHAVILVAAIALGTRTVYRNCDYLDPVLLWRKVQQIAPHNDRARTNIERHLQQNW